MMSVAVSTRDNFYFKHKTADCISASPTLNRTTHERRPFWPLKPSVASVSMHIRELLDWKELLQS